MDCSKSTLENYDTKLATKKFRILIVFALLLGVAELGVWSYKHHHRHALSQAKTTNIKANESSQVIAALSEDEKHWWASQALTEII